MFKLLTAVMIACTFSFTTYAMDLDVNLSVKSIIRAKLWYEGIPAQDKTKNIYTSESQNPHLPEEILIPLEKIDA